MSYSCENCKSRNTWDCENYWLDYCENFELDEDTLSEEEQMVIRAIGQIIGESEGNNTRKIWDRTVGKYGGEVNMPESMLKFLEDINEVCKKHNLSISHEDYHGGFIIEEYDEHNIEWLFDATKGYKDRT